MYSVKRDIRANNILFTSFAFNKIDINNTPPGKKGNSGYNFADNKIYFSDGLSWVPVLSGGTSSNIFVSSRQTFSANGPLNLDDNVFVSTTGTYTGRLQPGIYDGQRKQVIFIGGVGNFIIDTSTDTSMIAVGGGTVNTLTFDTTGQSVIIVYDQSGGNWYLGNGGVITG